MSLFTVSPYSVENIEDLCCVNRRGTELWRSAVGRESQAQYRRRLNTMIQAELPRHLESGKAWREFDPTLNNQIFPPVFNKFCLQYAGYGMMLTYSLGGMRSALFALKDSSTLKRCLKPFEEVDFSELSQIEEIGHVVVKYKNGKSLDIDPKERFAVWMENGKEICGYEMRPDETASQLLAAIERYAEGGDLDARYGLFMVKPLGLSLRELSLREKGRFLEDELGL